MFCNSRLACRILNKELHCRPLLFCSSCWDIFRFMLTHSPSNVLFAHMVRDSQSFLFLGSQNITSDFENCCHGNIALSSMFSYKIGRSLVAKRQKLSLSPQKCCVSLLSLSSGIRIRMCMDVFADVEFI